jgi:hypothetical protein
MMMASLFIKKKAVGGSTLSSKCGLDIRHRLNQLHAAAQSSEEFLPSADSFRFSDSFKTIRRRHSTQRDQLASLRAEEVLKIAARAEMDGDRDGPSSGTTICNETGRWKSWPSSLSMDIYPPSFINCSALSLFEHDEVPFTISVKHPDDSLDEARSEISLEDVFLPMSSVQESTRAAPSEQSATPNWADNGWSYPSAVKSVTKSCTPASLADLYHSSDSSISWPSDEDDEDSAALVYQGLPTLDRQFLLGNQQCKSDYDNGSDYFKKHELTCGFKLWSEGGMGQLTLGGSNGCQRAARDVENCREADEKDQRGRMWVKHPDCIHSNNVVEARYLPVTSR